MTGSKVYFTDFHAKLGDNLLNKLDRLIRTAGIERIDMEKKFVAVKMHFGEYGNLSFIRPNYAKVIVDLVKKKGGIPFLTDCNTLYVGSRKNAIEHMDTAYLNGFTPMTVGCNVIIGDGINGSDDVDVAIDGDFVKGAHIGRAIHDSDIIITLTHFKCHELTGFGGAIKNLGMGCASKRGKMEQHSAGKPSIDNSKCRGCGTCRKVCGSDAISILDGKALIDRDRCAGCGMCISKCSFDAISTEMDQANDILCMKMSEYAVASVLGKPNFHITLLNQVSPFCDCHGENDVPVVGDIGMLASFDPVALDMACADLVNKAMISPDSTAYPNRDRFDDVFRCTQPTTDWRPTIDHSVKMGLGSSDYELIRIE